MNILTLAESVYINGREYVRLLAQSIHTPEKETTYKKIAKEATIANIDKGNYTDSQEVYLHPIKAKTPTNDKYKLSFR